MANGYADELLALAARLYYIDGLAQSEVARFTKVSQAKVSRLLALARERGIVRITVADYESRHPALERELQAKLALTAVIVVKAIDGLARDDLRRAVGHFAAPAVAALIEPGRTVAVAGGRTIHELASQLPEPRTLALTVVQAMGSVDSSVNAFDAQEIGRTMARRLGGNFHALNAPAFAPNKRTRDALLSLDQVRQVHAHLDRAQVALVGVGTLTNSVFVERNVMDASALRALESAGVVGEICGRFLNARGEECESAWRDCALNATVEQLRRIPLVLGIVSGNDRSEAILAAVRGRILKGLVIDEAGAAALLARLAIETPRSVSRSRK